MRAHMNCAENLPLFTALVVAIVAFNVKSALIDAIAIILLAARIGQTVVHIALPPTNSAAILRFFLFAVQVACMIAIGLTILRLTSV